MKCKKCAQKSLVSGFCKDHFIEYFEKTVKATITEFKLINKSDKVAVAVSGGKDSLVTLYVLNKLGYNIEGIAIDEGISDYREHTLIDLKIFCESLNIKYKIYSFEYEFGKKLEIILKKVNDNPCHMCGVLRRFLLNKYSKNYNVIATGHNLDDEAQAVMMNVLKSQVELSARLGPLTGLKYSKNFTKRVKPLYFLKDKEIKAYTILKNIKVKFSECPFSHTSFRSAVADELNILELKKEGSKLNLINNFLEILPSLKEKFSTDKEVNICQKCKEPSAGDVCRTCELIKKVGL